MEFLKIWRVLLGHKIMIICVTLSSTVVAVLMTYVLPEQYEATALILVKPKQLIKMTSNPTEKEVLGFPVSHNIPIDAPSKTYMEVMRSRAVAERVVRALHLDEPKPEVYDSYWEEIRDRVKEEFKAALEYMKHIFKYGEFIPIDPFEEAVTDVLENLSLEVKKKTNVFLISYMGRDPREAADVTNKFAEIFLEYRSESNKGETTSNRKFLEKRLQEVSRNLESARKALLGFKQNQQTFSLDKEYSEKLKIISKLEDNLEQTEVDLASLLKKYNPSSILVVQAQAKKDRFLQALAERNTEIQAHPGKEKQLKTLKLSIKVAEEAYSFINKKYEDARIQEATNIGEIRIISDATPPPYPAKPIKYYYGGGAFFVALIMGVGLAFFQESKKTRIRSIDDVTEVLQLRVLATIPEIKSSTKTRVGVSRAGAA